MDAIPGSVILASGEIYSRQVYICLSRWFGRSDNQEVRTGRDSSNYIDSRQILCNLTSELLDMVVNINAREHTSN